MEEKVEKLEAHISKLEEGMTTSNMEEIAKYLDGSNTSEPVVDLDFDEDAIEVGNMDSAPSGAAKRTRVSMKKVALASSKELSMQEISEKLANALKNIK